MPVVDPSLYEGAAQVRWILHLACAATFTLVMSLLAVRLQRPIMRTIAEVWVWQTVVAVNLFTYFEWPEAFAASAGLRFLSTLALHVPHLLMAPLLRHTRRLVTDGEASVAPSARTLAVWAAVGLLSTVLDQTAKAVFPGAEETLTIVVSRLIALVPYAYALWPDPTTASAAHGTSSETDFTRRALRVALWARVIALAIDFVIRSVPWSGEVRVVLTATVVTVNLVALVTFGTLLLFVALEHERAVSARREAELYAAKLRQSHSRRLESLGGLAGGVAHDFNNILSVVVSSSDMARSVADDPTLLVAELDAIGEAGRQGMSLTRQLLDFAKQRPATTERFDPAAVLERLRPICERALTAARPLEWRVAAAPRLMMDTSQFEQVVLNLVVNARDAIERNGTVTVTLSEERVGRARAAAMTLAVGTYVRLAVRDTGEGIPADVLPRIFDPFVTTKEARGGTGLGLATVQRVARENGGDVFVESTMGVGTTVEVWFAAA